MYSANDSSPSIKNRGQKGSVRPSNQSSPSPKNRGQKGSIRPNNQSSPGPIGNTQGIIVPVTSPNASGANNSAPPPQPAPKEESWWGSWGSAVTHTVLDVVGLIPVVGEVADGANALIYRAEGDYVNAAISAAAMIPFAGDAVTAGKWLWKGGKQVAKAVEEKAAKEAAEAGAKKLEREAAAKLEREVAERAAKEAAQKLEKEAAKKAAKKAAKEAKQKPARKRKKNEEGGHIEKQRPHKNCGKLTKYSQAPSGRKEAGLEADHIPSGKALEKAMLAKLKKIGKLEDLTDKQLTSMATSLKNQAPTITIPKDVHAEGNTWRSKNTAERSSADAKDLKAAAKRDAEAIQKSMDGKDHGCSKAYKQAAEKLIETTDFDKLIDTAIERGLKRFGK